MKAGSKVKNFKAEMTGKADFNLADYKGKRIVIYFYPRDNTPGCTSEGEDFRAVSYTHLTLPTILLV